MHLTEMQINVNREFSMSMTPMTTMISRTTRPSKFLIGQDALNVCLEKGRLLIEVRMQHLVDSCDML